MAMGNMSMGHMAPMGPWPPMMGPMGMADPGMMMGAAMGYPQVSAARRDNCREPFYACLEI